MSAKLNVNELEPNFFEVSEEQPKNDPFATVGRPKWWTVHYQTKPLRCSIVGATGRDIDPAGRTGRRLINAVQEYREQHAKVPHLRSVKS